MTDRRRLPRYPCHWQATVVFPAIYRNVTVLDLSLSGALIEPVATRNMEGFAPRATCTVRIRTANGEDVLDLCAIVARLSADGRVGLVLREGSLRAQRILHRLIEIDFGTAELPERGRCALPLPRFGARAPEPLT
jgi:hypothetical protein